MRPCPHYLRHAHQRPGSRRAYGSAPITSVMRTNGPGEEGHAALPQLPSSCTRVARVKGLCGPAPPTTFIMHTIGPGEGVMRPCPPLPPSCTPVARVRGSCGPAPRYQSVLPSSLILCHCLFSSLFLPDFISSFVDSPSLPA